VFLLLLCCSFIYLLISIFFLSRSINNCLCLEWCKDNDVILSNKFHNWHDRLLECDISEVLHTSLYAVFSEVLHTSLYAVPPCIIKQASHTLSQCWVYFQFLSKVKWVKRFMSFRVLSVLLVAKAEMYAIKQFKAFDKKFSVYSKVLLQFGLFLNVRFAWNLFLVHSLDAACNVCTSLFIDVVIKYYIRCDTIQFSNPFKQVLYILTINNYQFI